MQHRPPPHDRFPRRDQEAHREDLHAGGFDGLDLAVHQPRRLVDAEEVRNAGAVDVGVHQADLGPGSGPGRRRDTRRSSSCPRRLCPPPRQSRSWPSARAGPTARPGGGALRRGPRRPARESGSCSSAASSSRISFHSGAAQVVSPRVTESLPSRSWTWWICSSWTALRPVSGSWKLERALRTAGSVTGGGMIEVPGEIGMQVEAGNSSRNEYSWT